MGRYNHIAHAMRKCYVKSRTKNPVLGFICVCVCKMTYHICKIIYSNDIHYKVDFADNVYFCHNGFGIVINPYSTIGSGTMIQHGVTIGEIDGSHASPKIGTNCFIGARAILLGGIKIGDNVKIGAGAVVLNDIPSNCTAVGVPARIVKNNVIAPNS